EVFDARLGARPNQLDRLRDDVRVSADQLLDIAATPGSVTIGGVRGNISVGVRYIASWLAGTGAAAIDNLMEDAATAEISRSQIWQWVRHGRVERVQVEGGGAGGQRARGEEEPAGGDPFPPMGRGPEVLGVLAR